LKKVCSGQAAQGKMHAKSGSMRGIRAYSGYVETAEGHQIAFAIIANGFSISSDAMISKMEPFFNGMATFQAQPK
jgi:D-alanyl-D-alanine carboxypeptidase/D-alanyl-D-alanine-endopeptidase (penicillin-binding protein 4)